MLRSSFPLQPSEADNVLRIPFAENLMIAAKYINLRPLQDLLNTSGLSQSDERARLENLIFFQFCLEFGEVEESLEMLERAKF